MAGVKDFFKKILEFLMKSSLFQSFPLSFLSFGLEALMDHHFSCPCNNNLNMWLTLGIFIGPALFIFCLMFLVLRPLRQKWFHCPDGEIDDTQKNCLTDLACCLIPPAMWIVILLFDGDYLACGFANSDGDYVFDEKLNISWCKPISEDNNTRSSNSHGNIQDTVNALHWSKVNIQSLYIIIIVLSVPNANQENENNMSSEIQKPQHIHIMIT